MISYIVNKKLGLIFLIWFSILTILFTSFQEGYLSIILLWLMAGGIGIGILRISRFGKDKILIKLFLFSYCVYTLYMLLTNFALVENPSFDYFYTFDSTKFWKVTPPIYSFSELWNIYNKNAEWATAQYRLFNFICLCISYVAEFIDHNNIVVQRYQTVFLAALSIPYVYLIIRKYTNRKFSVKTACFFAIFGFVSTFSAVYGRDIHIYFIYTYAFYLILYYDTRGYGLLKLIIFAIIAFYIRFENGIFLSCFILAYIYLNSSKKKYIKILALVLIPLILSVTIKFSSIALETYSNYSSKMEEADVDNSIAAAFTSLPFGVRQVALSFVSQTYPIPFYKVLGLTDRNVIHPYSFSIFRLPESISGLVWPFIWGIIVYAFAVIKVKFKQIPTELLIVFAIAVLHILSTSANLSVRRIIAAYPAIFAFSMYFYFRFSKKQRQIANRYSFCFLLLSYGLYFVLN